MSGKHTPDEMAPGGLKRMAEVWHPDLPIQINWTWELDDGINANIFCPGNAQRWKMARIEAGSRPEDRTRALQNCVRRQPQVATKGWRVDAAAKNAAPN